MWFPLRLKFFLFATLIAVVPLALVGRNLSTLTRDELKSAANEDLMNVAQQLRTEFDSTFQGRWLTPLMVIRNGIDSDELGVAQKVSLLTLGLQEMPQVVSLQLSVADTDLPIMASNPDFSEKLTAAGLDPLETLKVSNELIRNIDATGQYGRPQVSQLPGTGDWIATLALPLTTKIAGRQVTLAARIELSLLGDMVARNPFAQRGEITVIDQSGRTVLGARPEQLLATRVIVGSALPLILAGARADALVPYARADGTRMLGAYAFPEWFQWAIITELPETSAYGVVNAIMERIWIIGLLGFFAATIAALVFARQLTGPILKIGQVAQRVGEGDFSARVQNVRRRDEIGELSGRINQMIAHLGERLELMKFVSRGTVSAIQQAEQAGISRGGERRAVSVIFTDIRGYTEFSERVAPEVVIETLNLYFDVQTDVVEKHGGDIDKFIGDALVAVFEGAEMEARATACAVEITEEMMRLLDEYPEYNLHVGIGIASGEVVMGAMGARARMDFTVLGSTVNKSARLCSKASPEQVLIDAATRDGAQSLGDVWFETLDPIPLKGYAAPVPAFAARRSAPRAEEEATQSA